MSKTKLVQPLMQWTLRVCPKCYSRELWRMNQKDYIIRCHRCHHTFRRVKLIDVIEKEVTE